MRYAAVRTRKLARDMLIFWKRIDKEQVSFIPLKLAKYFFFLVLILNMYFDLLNCDLGYQLLLAIFTLIILLY